MIKWLLKKVGAAFVLRDSERTLAAVLRMPRAQQVQVAERIAEMMATAEDAMAEMPARPSREVLELAARIGHSARHQRHLAIARGARDWSDPDWATAALIESWALGLGGSLGEAAFADINVGLRVFVTRTLRPPDYRPDLAPLQ